MVLEPLLAGILMAAGAFAVKAGFGLHYLGSSVSGRPWARAGISGAFALASRDDSGSVRCGRHVFRRWIPSVEGACQEV